MSKARCRLKKLSDVKAKETFQVEIKHICGFKEIR
jgi:hypothetical protein